MDKNGKEWNYCIFHLPKGDVPEEVKKELDEGRRRELERFLALDGEDKKKVIGDFNAALEEYIIDTKSGEDLDLDIAFFFQGFWFHNIDLSKRTFKEPALFKDCIFTGKSNFEGIKFSGVSFIDAKFLGKANFFASTFSEETYFIGAKFLRNASFVHSKFLEKADFSMIKFLSLDEKLDFSHSEFHNSFIFRNSALSGILSFKNSIFLRNGVVDFTDVEISNDGIIYLTDAFLDNIMVFQDIGKLRLVMGGIRISEKGEIRFIKCDLSEVSFLQVSDMDRITFMGVKWPTLGEIAGEDFILKLSIFIPSFIVLFMSLSLFMIIIGLYVEPMIINDIGIEIILIISTLISVLISWGISSKSESIYLYRKRIFDDMLKIATKTTKTPENLNYIKDINHNWCRECSSLVLVKENERCPICNSENLDEIDEKEIYEYITIAYEQLRLNYELHNRHTEAGMFYIGEMESKRKNPDEYFYLGIAGKQKEKKPFLLWIKRNLYPTSFYKYFSLYGESLYRPIAWIFGFGIFFSLIFDMYLKMDIQNALSASFLTMYQTPPPDIPGILALPERLLGLLFNTLFILALNRKFRRKGKIS